MYLEVFMINERRKRRRMKVIMNSITSMYYSFYFSNPSHIVSVMPAG